MRFALSAMVAIATSVTLVAAQDLSGIPPCAIPCFAAALPSTGCSVTDTKCQCTTGRPAMESALAKCAPSRCTTEDIAALAPIISTLCGKAGVTITDLPTGIPSGSGSASGASASMTASVTGSDSATGTEAASPSKTGAAGVNVIGWGAMAMGMAAGVLAA